MKNLFKAAIVAVAMCLPAATMAKITHLLPKPQQIEAKSGAAFALGRTVTITDPTNCTALQKFFTDNADEIFNDESINLIVELIDDAEAAYHIVKRALQSGLSVVSGNKKMLAHHLPELIELQQKHNVALLYDASACGSIPVIRNLEEYYDNDLLCSVKGILNGSSNFILESIDNYDNDRLCATCTFRRTLND